MAISNRRLIAADANSVTFNYKDYRIEGAGRYKTMTLETAEFIRRFLMHVLPKGLHRIRHYGPLAVSARLLVHHHGGPDLVRIEVVAALVQEAFRCGLKDAVAETFAD